MSEGTQTGMQTLALPDAPIHTGDGSVIDVHCGWGALPTAPYWNDISKVAHGLYERGIGQAFASSLLARRYDLLAGNDALADALDREPEEDTALMRGWLVLHPARLAESNNLLRRHLYSPHFVGAALYADVRTGAPIGLREGQELIASFRRYGKPLLMETPNAESVARAVEIADFAGSTVKIIASGMGGDEWREAIVIGARPLNLLFDISGALIPDKIPYAIEQFHGTRKLFFASGAPHTDPALVLGMLDDVTLPPEDRARILHTNAEKLFGRGGVGAAGLPLNALSAPGGNNEEVQLSVPT